MTSAIRILLPLAIPLALAALPALAGPKCAASENPMPMWQVAMGFEEEGGKIRQMKLSDGCYEIVGTEGDSKVEIYFDPTSGVVLEREDD
jgi:hypothetical protein